MNKKIIVQSLLFFLCSASYVFAATPDSSCMRNVSERYQHMETSLEEALHEPDISQKRVEVLEMNLRVTKDIAYEVEQIQKGYRKDSLQCEDLLKQLILVEATVQHQIKSYR